MLLILAAALLGDTGLCLRLDYPVHFATQPYAIVDSGPFGNAAECLLSRIHWW